jgi:hypothetical protein
VRLLDGRTACARGARLRQFTTPKSRSSRRLIELEPRTQSLLSERWQETAFCADEDLVFCHPQKGTPLDPSKLARVYLRPALKGRGTRSRSDLFTTSRTRR